MSLSIAANRCGAICVSVAIAAVLAFPQSGGPFEIEKFAIASGGNTSSGGSFTLDSTTGQNVIVPVSRAGPFELIAGFWTPEFVATAAPATISGRVSQTDGTGIPGAVVIATGWSGNVRLARTNGFGSFWFANLEVGQAYILSVSAKGYVFAPQVIDLQSDISGLSFLPLGTGASPESLRKGGRNDEQD